MVLGSAVGYAVAGKDMGKKAFLWGAFAGTLPDLDFIPILPFNDNFTYLKHHRGFSHSLLFTFLAPITLYYILKKYRPGKFVKSLSWLFFFAFATHILLDCFTSWGTQVFWPYPNRVAWNSIFIIDPGYTVPLLIALLISIFHKKHLVRQKWLAFGLGLSSAYLLLSLGIKWHIHGQFKQLFASKGLKVQRITTRPAPFNLILWSASAETKDGYYYGIISLFDKKLSDQVYFVAKNHELTKGYINKNTKELLAYTKGYYAVENTNQGILVHDLRYGFLGDPWLNGENFVFSYHLTKNETGTIALDIQNPRPENTSELLTQLWNRLKGI